MKYKRPQFLENLGTTEVMQFPKTIRRLSLLKITAALDLLKDSLFFIEQNQVLQTHAAYRSLNKTINELLPGINTDVMEMLILIILKYTAQKN